MIDVKQIKMEMNINMTELSTRLLLGNIGDSKIFLLKLTDSDEYIITIQNIESSNIAILGMDDGKYDFASVDGISPNEIIIIDSVTEKQLAELGSILSNRFPTKNHKE